jgi:hypothetical protein
MKAPKLWQQWLIQASLMAAFFVAVQMTHLRWLTVVWMVIALGLSVIWYRLKYGHWRAWEVPLD